MIGRLICWWKGQHKRGKPAPDVACQVEERAFRCPRCLATWTRKAKAKAGQPA